MSEPTIACPNCKQEIKLGNSEIMPGRGNNNSYLIRVLSPMMFREPIRGLTDS